MNGTVAVIAFLSIFIGSCKTPNRSAVADDGLGQSQLHPEFERYEGGSAAAETALIKDLANKFALSQAGIGASFGKTLRGTHAKGSCVEGNLEIFDSNDASLQVGPYGKADKVDARIRFANGGSKHQSDLVPDVRAMSFSFTSRGQRVDLSMNNDPTFPFPSLTDFNHFMAFALKSANLQGQVAKGLIKDDQSKQQMGEFMRNNPALAAAVQRVGALGGKQQNKDVISYATENYNTGSAYLFGQNRAVKFTMTQCGGKQPLRQKPAAEAGENYLQDGLKTTIERDAASMCFDFGVEILDAASMKGPQGNTLEPWQWVEDTTLDWTAAGAKTQLLGKLTFKPGSFKTAEACDDVRNYFDVNKHTHPDLRPIGRINRARLVAELQSQKIRGRKP